MGNAGNITINAKTFEARNGGELVSTSSGSRSAGNIQVHATDWVSVNGSDPTVEERRIMFKNIRHTDLANVETNSGFFVRASGSGSAGDIEVNAPQVRLDNSGKFSAESISGNGGDIKVLAGDLLLLRGGSMISATAGTNQFGGNGGNITINTPSGVVAGVRSENSDITANAYEGRGGFINITARGVFGLQRSNQLTLFSDITAFSQQNPQLNGVVQLNVSDVDPSSGLVVLPTNLIDASSRLRDASCAALNSNKGNEFVVTGRSGLPPSPDEPLTSDVVWTDTRLPVTTAQHQHKTHAAKPKPQPIAIIPATSWVLNNKGEVMLISSAANTTSVKTPTNCPVR
ncbi:MAG: S-layer family protein [Rhizonema sp. PD38]|nr:S-layer family protein [Rhizonema sp. PD38]